MNLKQKSAPQRLLWAQFDALQMGSGWEEEDVTKPQILLEDAFGDSHPGSTHLSGLMEQAKYGVFEKGGFPAQYHTTDICDGCAQGHDGRFSGATRGAAIGHVSPEAASGGPLAFLETGDIVAYSVKNRTLDIVGIQGKECSPEEVEKILAERSGKGVIPRPERKGIYKRYTSHALSAMQGAGYED